MSSYGMYSMNGNGFGGGLMDWMPNAKTAIDNANSASNFIEEMQQRRARSELLPMQLYNNQLGTGYEAMVNKIKLDLAADYNSQNNLNRQMPVGVNRDEWLRRLGTNQSDGVNVTPATANTQYYSPNAGITPQVSQGQPQSIYGANTGGEVSVGTGYPTNPTLASLLGK